MTPPKNLLIASIAIYSLFIANLQAAESATPQAAHAETSVDMPLDSSTLDETQGSMNTVNKLIAENKIKTMETQLRATVNENPESVDAKLRLAGFLMSQNKTGESIPFFQDAITLTPENPKLFASLSVAYLHQSQYGMAKAMADEALRLSPDMAQAKKLNEYIDAKQEVLEMAEKASAPTKFAPDDNLHNAAE